MNGGGLSWEWAVDEKAIATVSGLLHDQPLDLDGLECDQNLRLLKVPLLLRARSLGIPLLMPNSDAVTKHKVALVGATLRVAGASDCLLRREQGVRFYELVCLQQIGRGELLFRLEPRAELIVRGELRSLALCVSRKIVGYQETRRWLGIVEHYGKITLIPESDCGSGPRSGGY